jgi:hypothetical protein
MTSSSQENSDTSSEESASDNPTTKVSTFSNRVSDLREETARLLVRSMDYNEVKKNYEGEGCAVEKAEDRLISHFWTTFREYVIGRILRTLVIALVIGTVIHWYIQPVPLQTYGI